MTEPRATAGEYGDILNAVYGKKPARWTTLLILLNGKIPIEAAWNSHAVARWNGNADDIDVSLYAEHLASGGNIGLVIPPGLIVLDCDSHATGQWVGDQLRSFFCVPDNIEGPWPIQQSRIGRKHFILRIDPELEISQGSAHLSCGRIDLRVAGKGQIVVAPSVHPETGEEYRWLVPLPADLDDIPMIPEELLKTLMNAQASTQEKTPAEQAQGFRSALQSWDTRLDENEGRNNELARLLGGILKNARHSEFQSFLEQAIGINQTAFKTPLPTREVETTARSIWRYPHAKGYPKKDVTGSDTPEPGFGRRYDTIERTQVDWLWLYHIPVGELVVLDGDGGIGKSLLTIDLAARLSTGRAWPDGQLGATPAGVVLCCGEDDAGSTVRPRLEAAEADLERIQDLRFPDFTSMADTQVLEQAVKAVEAKLVILDPAMDYLPDVADSHKDDQIRHQLHEIKLLARQMGFCLWLNRHLAKGASSGTAAHAGLGSVSWTNQARCVFGAYRIPDRSGQGRFVMTKTNLAPPSSMFECAEYELVNAGDDWDPQLRLEWRERIRMSADDAFKISRGLKPEPGEEEPSARRGAPPRARQEAELFLQTSLWKPARLEWLNEKANELSINPRTLARARAALGVIAFSEGGERMVRLPTQ